MIWAYIFFCCIYLKLTRQQFSYTVDTGIPI
jgi:hypothetical protein